MKTVDVIAAVLVVIGALNWGLVGVAGLDVVAALLGEGTIAARVVYVLVGLGGLWQAVGIKAIQKRWHVRPQVGEGQPSHA